MSRPSQCPVCGGPVETWSIRYCTHSTTPATVPRESSADVFQFEPCGHVLIRAEMNKVRRS